MKKSIKEKMYVIIISVFGLYLGFNIGLSKSIYLISGLIIGFILGRLDKLEKQDGRNIE